MRTNSFLFQISGSTFHVVLDFHCALFIAKHCYSPNSDKRIPKVRSEKILLFFRKETFSNLVFPFIAEKKIAKKFTIFFPYTKIAKQNNSQYAKFLIKNFAKYIISQTSYKKEIHENIVKKIFAEIFLWKKKFAKKKSIKKIFTKKKICKKKFEKNLKNNFGNFFIFEKKFG